MASVDEEHESRAFVWGSGGAGQLGLGNCDDFAIPQELGHLELVPETITTGGCHSLGWSERGELYVWGDNEKQQLARPRDLASLIKPTLSLNAEEGWLEAAACGWSHTVIVTSRPAAQADTVHLETVLSWGSPDHQQLGRPVTDDQPNYSPFPVDLPGLVSGRRVVSVSCGWKHSLLVVDDGSVFSWGSGRHGELGLGGSQFAAPEPTLVGSVRDYDISSVYCGWQHSVFFSSRSGYVFTCGNNRHGQLGVPKASESARSLPGKVVDASGSLLQCSQIAAGWHFVLCVSMDATLVSWGKGSHGQLGLESLENVEIPTAIHFEDPVASIACGSEHTMVVTKQGDLFTCGWGEHGNLGHGDTENRSSLTKVQFFDDHGWQVVSVKAGGAVSIALARRRLTKIISM